MRALSMFHSGDRESAREELLKLWEQSALADAPAHRCMIAHFLADTEVEPSAELEWDLRALEAATGWRDDVDHGAVDPELDGYLPSLHLNVGDACRRLGELKRAQRHAENGLKHASALEHSAYGASVKAALIRLCDRLATLANSN